MVVNEKSHPIPIIIFQIPDQLARLLCNPGYVGVRRASCQMNSSGIQFDEEQHIDGLELDRLLATLHFALKSLDAG